MCKKTIGKLVVKGLTVATVAATEAALKAIFKKDIEDFVEGLGIVNKIKGITK